eukprot:gene25129-biopygen10426
MKRWGPFGLSRTAKSNVPQGFATWGYRLIRKYTRVRPCLDQRGIDHILEACAREHELGVQPSDGIGRRYEEKIDVRSALVLSIAHVRYVALNAKGTRVAIMRMLGVRISRPSQTLLVEVKSCRNRMKVNDNEQAVCACSFINFSDSDTISPFAQLELP